jgi:hypothetical protein
MMDAQAALSDVQTTHSLAINMISDAGHVATEAAGALKTS